MIFENIILRKVIINRGAAEADNHISRDDIILVYYPIRECNIDFIIPNIRSFTSFTKMVLLNSLNARTDHDVQLNKLHHKKSMASN